MPQFPLTLPILPDTSPTTGTSSTSCYCSPVRAKACWAVDWACDVTVCERPQPRWVWVQWPWRVQRRHSQRSSSRSGSHIPPTPSAGMVPEARVGGWWKYSLRTEHSSGPVSQLLDQLWISALTSTTERTFSGRGGEPHWPMGASKQIFRKLFDNMSV